MEREIELKTLNGLFNLGVTRDMPIMLDYWSESLKKKVFIGIKEDGEKLLVKNEEEYTSPIKQVFKTNGEFIILTENSIYLVDNKIPQKKIK